LPKKVYELILLPLTLPGKLQIVCVERRYGGKVGFELEGAGEVAL
jgi:hypothetical protein